MTDSEDTLNVLIFGDSNTWGYDCKSLSRYPTKLQWPNILQNILGNRFNIIADGLNGRTVAHTGWALFADGEYEVCGRNQLPAVVHSHKPLDLILVALGANDVQEKYHTKPIDIAWGIQTIVRDIQKMSNIGRFRMENMVACDKIPPKILVLSLPVIKYFEPYGSIYHLPRDVFEKAAATNELLPIFCGRVGVDYLDIQPVGISDIDGLHFTLEQQPFLAELVAQKIAAMFS
jgi:lysophospholipase L1-like esterase